MGMGEGSNLCAVSCTLDSFRKLKLQRPCTEKLTQHKQDVNCVVFLLGWIPSELVNTTIINGKTGDIVLNRKGDRINTAYQIVNLRKKGDKKLRIVGEYRDWQVSISDKVFWPGGLEEKPKGIFVSTHLRVGIMHVCKE